jgi:hypothetical protein
MAMRNLLAIVAVMTLLICHSGALALEVQEVATPPLPESPVFDDINCLATIDDIVSLIPALKEPLGHELGVMIWEASGRPDPAAHDALEVERLLQERGMCVPPNIGKADEAGLDAIATIIRHRQEQGWATPVLCQGWGQVFFRPERSPAHQPPAEQDAKRFPCIARYEEPLLGEKARVEANLDALVARGIAPEIFLMDWELWYRAVWPGDGSGFAAALEQALACPVCREQLPAEYLQSPADLMRGLEILRGEIARRAFAEPLKQRFPDAHIGNYFCGSHVRSDEPLTECSYVMGWHGSGFDFSQPRAYGNFWRYHRSAEHVGWNVFRQALGEYSHMARHQVGDEYQVPWSTRILSYEPVEPFEAQGGSGPLQVWAWPRESYREYQRHVLLRGAKGLCVFQTNRAVEGNRVAYLTELQDVAGVFAEMREFADILREGTPMNLDAPPGEAYSSEGAVVWSGMATNDRAVVRTVSFTGSTEEVTIAAFGEEITLQAPPEGQTWLITK